MAVVARSSFNDTRIVDVHEAALIALDRVAYIFIQNVSPIQNDQKTVGGVCEWCRYRNVTRPNIKGTQRAHLTHFDEVIPSV